MAARAGQSDSSAKSAAPPAPPARPQVREELRRTGVHLDRHQLTREFQRDRRHGVHLADSGNDQPGLSQQPVQCQRDQRKMMIWKVPPQSPVMSSRPSLGIYMHVRLSIAS
jgi:hypothetical protein